MRGMIQSFEDPNTFFVEPQPRTLERDQLRGSFGGIDAYIETDDKGYKLRPMRDQPAERAGIREGDRLIAIDPQSISAETSMDQVVTLIRGEIGTKVTLTIQRYSDTTEAQEGKEQVLLRKSFPLHAPKFDRQV